MHYTFFQIAKNECDFIFKLGLLGVASRAEQLMI